MNSDEGVSLIIHRPLESIHNVCGEINPEQLKEWKRTIYNEIVSGVTYAFIEYFKPVNIVDRNQLSAILKELELSQTGILSDKIRLKAGKVLVYWDITIYYVK